jgi:protein-disulfide isomerase
LPPPLISKPFSAPIYGTMSNKVNLVCAAALALVACNPSRSAPAGDAGASATSPATAAAATPAAATQPDPIVAAADHGRIEGDANAKTWLIVASDFQCPFCKQWHDESYKIVYDDYVRSGKIKVAYVNYPLQQHQNAQPAAEAAMCASAQGKFWQYHEALFATQHQWEELVPPTAFLDSLAGTIGLDKPAWQQCVASGKMKALIAADHDRVGAAGVASTPSFLIGDKVLAGAQPIAVLRAAIDSELAKSGAAAH